MKFQNLFPLLNSGANAAPASVRALMLAMLEPKLQAMVFSISSLTFDNCDSGDYPTGG